MNIDKYYRGYVRCKGKVPIDKFKGTKLLTYEQVKDSESYAGVLAEDIILIDIDNQEQSEVLMNIIEAEQIDCLVYQTTRGRHYLFKNTDVKKCATNIKLAIGLTADIKVGTVASIECLKVDGEERFCEWGEPTLEPQVLPKWLLPVKTTAELYKMKPGDGRNQELFKYILTLTNTGLNKTEARKCLELINEYILDTPLPERELETIMRDDAFPVQELNFFDGNKFHHDEFAKHLLNKDHIKRINGQLHIYKDGVYVSGYHDIEAKMIEYIPTIKDQQRKETLKYLEIVAPDAQLSAGNFIAFRNGIYDIDARVLRAFSPDVIITNKIPHEYSASAYDKTLDNVLNKLSCGNKDIRSLLEECVGYCFTTKRELGKFIVLVGDKANGKSTYLNLIKDVLGESNYSALDIDQLDDRFSTSMMFGKLANIGDDISDEFLKGSSTAVLKKLTTGNNLKAEFKGRDNFTFKPTAALVFSVNNIPRMKDPTGAIIRRLLFVPFNATFSKDDPDYDPYITYKLRSEDVIKYMIRLGVEGLSRIFANKGFTECELSTQTLEEYEEYNNPVLAFCNDQGGLDYILRNDTKTVYHDFKFYCSENSYQCYYTPLTFGKMIKSIYKVETYPKKINGELIRVYKKTR